jgi:hypothetical protein
MVMLKAKFFETEEKFLNQEKNFLKEKNVLPGIFPPSPKARKDFVFHAAQNKLTFVAQFLKHVV